MNNENLKPYEFKPGQSGNPEGRPPDPAKAIKAFNKADLASVHQELIESTVEELKRIRSDAQTKPIKAAVASYLLFCVAKGIYPDALLDRTVGRVPQKTELTGTDGSPIMPPQIIYAPVQVRDRPAPPPPEPDAT